MGPLTRIRFSGMHPYPSHQSIGLPPLHGGVLPVSPVGAPPKAEKGGTATKGRRFTRTQMRNQSDRMKALLGYRPYHSKSNKRSKQNC